jgi:ribosomal protein L22
MPRRFTILIVFAMLLSGCGPTPQEKYDDAERQTAANAVCREIAGTTTEESASAALQGLGNVLNQTAPPPTDASKQGEPGKKVASGRRGDELDKTIDGLIAAEKNAQEKEAALTAPLAKANEVMSKIKTPGTPEAKRYEEKLDSMPEVQAYKRQQKRVEQAQKDVDEAKAALPK